MFHNYHSVLPVLLEGRRWPGLHLKTRGNQGSEMQWAVPCHWMRQFLLTFQKLHFVYHAVLFPFSGISWFVFCLTKYNPFPIFLHSLLQILKEKISKYFAKYIHPWLWLNISITQDWWAVCHLKSMYYLLYDIKFAKVVRMGYEKFSIVILKLSCLYLGSRRNGLLINSITLLLLFLPSKLFLYSQAIKGHWKKNIIFTIIK